MSAQRIMFVEASAGGVVGGSLTGILHLIPRLDRRRFAPSLTLFESKPIIADMEVIGVPVHVLPPLPVPREPVGRLRLGRALERLSGLHTVVAPRARALIDVFRRERPDLVYLANGLPATVDGVVATAICRLPVVCHEKGFRSIGPIERLLSRWVDLCISMTDEIAEHYRARHVRARRFVTIYDGIDCDHFVPQDGAAIRREFGIPLDAPLVGIVGHIQDWKGQLLVAEAVARARRRCPALRCLVVGGVHRRGERYAAELRARIAAPDVGDAVILAGARQDVAACMSAMDVVIHASTREPFGRVLIEAMALGKPLVAPREGGPLVIVEDGRTGLLVPPRDADALADALVELLADPFRRQTMGAAARARVDAVFDIRHHVRAIEAVLDEVLGSTPLAAAAGAGA
jgi:glycosyltransferase involved in cell wall biosynthesis